MNKFLGFLAHPGRTADLSRAGDGGSGEVNTLIKPTRFNKHSKILPKPINVHNLSHTEVSLNNQVCFVCSLPLHSGHRQ